MNYVEKYYTQFKNTEYFNPIAFETSKIKLCKDKTVWRRKNKQIKINYIEKYYTQLKNTEYFNSIAFETPKIK